MAQSSHETKTYNLEDFLELSYGELQFFLKQRGLPVSGNHGYLAARAFLAYKQKIELVATAAQISNKLKAEYDELLKKHAIDFDPLEAHDFVEDFKNWPKTNIGQIFSYFLESKAFASEYVGQYKLRKAYSFFGSGFVDKILVRKFGNREIAVSSVTPSQRIKETKHRQWISFNLDGSIITAFCTCTAGHSQCCNHVAAALYKIEYANEKGITDPACTDEACQWNTAAKEVTPLKVKDMHLVMHKRGKSEKQKKFLMCKEKQGFDPRHQGAQEVSEEDKAAFLANIKQVLTTAVVNHTFAPSPEKDVPPSLLEIASNSNFLE